MTEEQYNLFKMNNSVSSLTSNSGDRVQDLMEEIYYEGFKEGYGYAVSWLELFGPSMFGCNLKKYFDKHMPTIHARLDAIREIEEAEDADQE